MHVASRAAVSLTIGDVSPLWPGAQRGRIRWLVGVRLETRAALHAWVPCRAVALQESSFNCLPHTQKPITLPTASVWGLATLPWLSSPDGEQVRCCPTRSCSYLLYVVYTEIYL